MTISSDSSDFEFASRGLISILNPCIITSDKDPSKVIWDNEAFGFLAEEAPTELVSPSLWRQSQLCQNQGLFQVVDGIYQVRGLDMGNMTIVEIPGTDGIVIIDPLSSVECTRKALKLYEDSKGKRTIKALIYTHSPVGQFSGARAIEEAAGSEFPVYAPEGFLESAIDENIYAGNTISRRNLYKYAQALDKSPMGNVGCGLGMGISTGSSGLMLPTVNLNESNSVISVGGLQIECQFPPGSHAPAEMSLFFPQYKALYMGDIASHTLQGIRGSQGSARDTRMWSKYIDKLLALYSTNVDVVFAGYHWPTWGNKEAISYLASQRDTVPAIYTGYVGWFDNDPAREAEYPPAIAAERYVESMGGVDKVVELGQKYRDDGDLRFAATLLNHALLTDKSNKSARESLQDVYRKLGYAAENALVRNTFLTGAHELENPPTPAQRVISSDILTKLSLEQLFDTLAIRIEGPKAWDTDLTIDFMVDGMAGDSKSQAWHLNLSNGAVTGHTIPYLPSGSAEASANLTIWLTHQQLVSSISNHSKDLEGLTISGDKEKWNQLVSFLTTPDSSFPIVPPGAPSS